MDVALYFKRLEEEKQRNFLYYEYYFGSITRNQKVRNMNSASLSFFLPGSATMLYRWRGKLYQIKYRGELKDNDIVVSAFLAFKEGEKTKNRAAVIYLNDDQYTFKSIVKPNMLGQTEWQSNLYYYTGRAFERLLKDRPGDVELVSEE